MSVKGKVIGSFLARALFKFVLGCILVSVSIIVINNYQHGEYKSTSLDTFAVAFASSGLILGALQLWIILFIDVYGSEALRGFDIYQGVDFCIKNEAGQSISAHFS